MYTHLNKLWKAKGQERTLKTSRKKLLCHVKESSINKIDT